MSALFESLEGRTLFAVTIPTNILQAGQQVVSDATELRTLYNDAGASAVAGIKALTADLKTQPKSRATALALTKVKIAFVSARASEAPVLARYLALGQADLVRVRSAYAADLKKPTTVNQARLTRALSALETGPLVQQDRFLSNLGTSNTRIDAALNALVAANPTDAALQGLVTTGQNNANATYTELANQCTTINNDITTLANDIQVE